MVCRDRGESVSGCTMHELEAMLEPYGFYCCHQFSLFSLEHITAVRDAMRQLYEAAVEGCTETFPVSRRRCSDLVKKLKENRMNII